MLEHLRGMFAFAIHDGRTDSVFLARDRFGKKPLYYTAPRGGGVLFASALKALRPLAAACGERWRVRPQSVRDYLALGVVPQPDTIRLYCSALGACWMVVAVNG